MVSGIRGKRSEVGDFKLSFLACLILMLVLLCPVAYASTSTSYAITPEVIDLGGNTSLNSASFILSSKLREISPVSATSSSFTLESRFTGIAYGGGVVSTLEIPNIVTVTPNSGVAGRTYKLVITGNFISSDATASLQKTGQADINATGEIIASDGSSMECYFNLTSAAVGPWNVAITNNGYGKTGVRGNAFTVSAAGPAEIIGIANNDPNPFDPSRGPTTIKYKLSTATQIALYLLNQKGEIIWRKEFSPNENGGMAGDNTVLWDAVNSFSNEDVPTGVYLLLIYSKSGGARELGRVKVAVIR